jgi:hypothetical protein
LIVATVATAERTAMNNGSFWEWEGKLAPAPGSNINAVIPEAIQLAKGRPFTFEFNEVTVTVCSDSDPMLIYRDWQRALSGYITGGVGPYPPVKLTAAELAHDAKVEAQNESRREASQRAYARAEAVKKAALDAKLATAPALALSDQHGWQSAKDANRDGYGGAVIVFAEQWARLIQQAIEGGAKLEDVADALVSEADTEGITGFMYGAAVSILSKVWKHGEELRRWHNLKTQIGTEGEKANESGGVLNPALLNVG